MTRLGEWWRNLIYGKRLHVAFDAGERDKPTIVFLHGIAATSKTWQELEHRLDYTKHRVVAIDLLGFGGSPMPDDGSYTPDEHCQYIHRTIRALHIKRPFVLVGHSMGSLLTVHYMTMWPDEVSRAVLVSMPLYIAGKKKQSRLSLLKNDFYQQAYNFFRTHRKFTVEGAQAVRKLLRLSDGIDVTEHNWQAFSKSLKNTIERQQTYTELLTIDKPIAMIYGSLDEFAVMGNAKMLAREHDNVTLQSVAGADHAVNKDMARAIVRTLA